MAKTKKLGSKRVRRVDGPAKKSPARSPLGPSRTDKGKKAPFQKGKKTAKRSGTS